MKKLTKIFMAVVAGMFAFSCVTDTTEDLGVNLGEGQTTTIDISLEESRTHLGVKDQDGNEYPLYWSEGDQIAVNGKASEALKDVAEGTQNATFKFNSVLSYPYNIVYPAPEEGVKAITAGQQVVTFKTSQVYTECSFTEGSVPMYGYVNDENDATTLNHLAGVLRIALYGADVTLNALTLSAESGKLSGNFDVNCEDGTLTAHADASNTLSVSFGTGLTIATTEAEATPIYVAVPAGTYGKITVTFYSSKGAMTKSFSTADKQIEAGKVREFPAFEYEEGATDTFIIYNEASLRTFASSASSADFVATYPNVRVVADIDLTGKEWESINGYTGSFDGGNHTISGLKAPFFGTTTATIKNVKLDININNTTLVTLGGLVCTYSGIEISNCSVSGSINVSDVAFTHIGGVVGTSETATTLSGLQNHANITVDSQITITNSYTYIAGCIGKYINSESGTINNCLNTGAITLAEDSSLTIPNASYSSLYVGGIVGSNQPSSLTDCENKGNININGTFSGWRLLVSGIVGDFRNGSIKGIRNSGNITFGAKSSITVNESPIISGLVGFLVKATAFTSSESNASHNSGNITIMKGAIVNAHSDLDKGTKIGGCFANSNNDTTIETVVSNSGNIEIGGTLNSTFHCGGLVGYTGYSRLDGGDGNTGNITITADAKLSGNYTNIGGLFGYAQKNILRSSNSGDILFEGECTSPAIYIGGVAGLTKGGSDTSVKCSNSGSITISNTATLNSGENGQINIGGIVGFAQSHVLDGNNSGPITISGECTAKAVRIGGITGYGNGGARKRCANSDKAVITINSALNCTTACIGGILGSTVNSIDTVTNNGDIVIASTATLPDGFYIGGVAGNTTYTASSSVNTGDILVNIAGTEGNTNQVSGGIANIDIACNNGKKISGISVYCDVVAVGHTNVGMITASEHSDVVKFSSCHAGGSIKKSNAEATPLTIDNYTTLIYGGGVEPNSEAENSVINVDLCGWLESATAEPQIPTAPNKIITTATDLIAWAADSATTTSTDVVALGADINLSTVTDTEWSTAFGEGATGWKTIENFVGTFNGKGYTINGLTAPMFGTLTGSATIKNVHLTGVNIDYGTSAYAGALVRYSNGENVRITDCSAEGTLTFKGLENAGTIYIGGLIGRVRQASKLSGLVNKVNITLANDSAGITYIGGCVGDTSSILSSTAVIENSKNLGTIEVASNFSSTSAVWIGGICSHAYEGFNKCTNGSLDETTKIPTQDGKITFNGKARGLLIGGIGALTPNSDVVTNCTNYATLEIAGSIDGNTYIGGIVSYNASDIPTNIEGCKNYGQIDVTTNNIAAGKSVYIAGVAGGMESKVTVASCENHGEVHVATSAMGANTAYVGGIVATITSGESVSNSSNLGNIIVEDKGTTVNTYIGGIAGYTTVEILNSKVACNVLADAHLNVGMVTGVERNATTPLVKNCAVAGHFSTNKEMQDVEEWWEEIKTLGEDNYYKYIYGSGAKTDWSGTDNYDGCTLDSTVVARPE